MSGPSSTASTVNTSSRPRSKLFADVSSRRGAVYAWAPCSSIVTLASVPAPRRSLVNVRTSYGTSWTASAASPATRICVVELGSWRASSHRLHWNAALVPAAMSVTVTCWRCQAEPNPALSLETWTRDLDALEGAEGLGRLKGERVEPPALEVVGRVV